MTHGPNDSRCPVCLAEYQSSALKDRWLPECPHCGTKIPPLTIRFDGYVKLNWQDLRVLAIYARRWASQFNLTLRGNRDAIFALENIIKAIERFRPAGAQELVPPVDVVTLRRLQPHPDLLLDENASMTPDAEGKIHSPFYRKGQPPPEHA